jgi:hypothetical protein
VSVKRSPLLILEHLLQVKDHRSKLGPQDSRGRDGIGTTLAPPHQCLDASRSESARCYAYHSN